MCENLLIHTDGEDYEDAVWKAISKVKDKVDETAIVHREYPGDSVGKEEDWFLRHADAELSIGGGSISVTFRFTRIGDRGECYD